MKTITLMTCTYNNAKILELAIKSMLELEMLNEIVEEIVIVDNASTDNTRAVVEAFAKSNKIIKYIYEGHQGVSYARRHAADIKTPWLIFVDDDNILCSGYVKKIQEIIERNKNLGVINGAGVAAPPPGVLYTDDEAKRLEVVIAALACSHSSLDSYKRGDKSHAEAPFGAGVALRTSPLKALSDKGWTKNEGRKGNALTSGEDGEIILSVLSEGFEYLFTPDVYFLHIIPQKRLSEEYLSRLFSGLGHGMYLCDIVMPDGKKKAKIYAIKNRMKLIYKKLYDAFSHNERRKMECHYKSYTWRAYISCCKDAEGSVASKL